MPAPMDLYEDKEPRDYYIYVFTYIHTMKLQLAVSNNEELSRSALPEQPHKMEFKQCKVGRYLHAWVA